ncbi:MAG: hypothetical protein N2045_10225 [Fimbriimonadales bacterium]|nr:hypothetical protein [Fimbriimonadales bacterium]GBC90668.1 hypothetical protein HRbin14_01412 [bacterium HR14]
MRNLWIWTSVLALAVAATATVQAQRRGEGQARPQPQAGQQERLGLRMMQGRGIAGMLLMRPDVQRELNLTEQQKAKINEMQQAMRVAMQELRNLPPDQRRQRMEEIRQKNDPTTVLTDAQKKRLRELELQWQGPMALMNPEIAREVGLTQEQQSKIQGILQEQFQAMRERFQQGGGQPDPQAFEKARQELENKILAVLTPAQREKWNQMLGKPFQFEGGRGFGPGFGGPRGGFGGPGGQRRGGQGFGQ